MARSSSNFGVTRKAEPFTGMIAASKRSLTPQRIPVKYSIEVPPVSMRASMLLAFINARAFSRRARRSSTVIGLASAFMEVKALIAGGRSEAAGFPCA